MIKENIVDTLESLPCFDKLRFVYLINLAESENENSEIDICLFYDIASKDELNELLSKIKSVFPSNYKIQMFQLLPLTLKKDIFNGNLLYSNDKKFVQDITQKTMESYQQDWYEKAADLIPDSRYIFMNHGYAKLNGDEKFNWVDKSDMNQKYSLNLVKHLLEDTSIENKVVLDVGCGRGGTCYYMCKYLCPKSVNGIDFCKGNIEFCNKNHKFKNLEFFHGNAHNIPFDEQSFDVVINIESSHCYSNVKRFFQEVYRVLKPRGIFCYTDIMASDRAKYIELLFTSCGFEIIKSEDIGKNVIKAIDLDRENLHSFLNSLKEKKLDNEQFLKDLEVFINSTIYNLYAQGTAQGTLVYMLWILRKVSRDA